MSSFFFFLQTIYHSPSARVCPLDYNCEAFGSVSGSRCLCIQQLTDWSEPLLSMFNIWKSFIKMEKYSLPPTHTHRERPHTLHIQTAFISSYWLLLYPVAWSDHTRQHRAASVFLPSSLVPSLHPSLAHPFPASIPQQHPPPNPLSPVSCLPFISFHLSSLLNSTAGIKAGCSDGVAAPPHKSIFTPLHISMLTNGLPF